MSIENDVEKLDSEIVDWDKNNLGDLRSKLDALNVKHVKRSPNKTALKRVLRSKLRKQAGLTNRISYSMPRSAIFLAKGVSKGHPISNPRTAKDWYNSVVDENIETLADIVAEGGANLIINNINIK
jgi:hypothetical protein